MTGVDLGYSLTSPVEAGFGRFLQAFHRQVSADTVSMQEFKARPFAEAAKWVPSRLADNVAEMIRIWRLNDSGTPSPRPKLPIMLACAGADVMPTDMGSASLASDETWGMIPEDPKERIFRLQVAQLDVRVQVAILAQDKNTARSIAIQLNAWASQRRNRRYMAEFRLAGIPQEWPQVISEPDIMAIKMPTDASNMTVLAADFNIRAHIPILRYPEHGSEEADGKGAGTPDDPDGYSGVKHGTGYNMETIVNLTPDQVGARWTEQTNWRGPQ